jgi:hypothetical protein
MKLKNFISSLFSKIRKKNLKLRNKAIVRVLLVSVRMMDLIEFIIFTFP